MDPVNDPAPPPVEQLEQYALGVMPAAARAALEERMHHDGPLREEVRRVEAYCLAIRAGLAERAADSPRDTVAVITDVELATYLDGALDSAAHAALEARLAHEPALLARTVALYREIQAVTNPSAEVVLAEKFLSGEPLPFVKREPAGNAGLPTTYEALAEAVEERKRRYLQAGN